MMPIIELTVYVQPNASKTEVSGKHGEYLKVRIKALPVEDQANAALIKFVAKVLGIKAYQLQLVRGHKNRIKTLRMDVSKEVVKQKSELLRYARFIEKQKIE